MWPNDLLMWLDRRFKSATTSSSILRKYLTFGQKLWKLGLLPFFCSFAPSMIYENSAAFLTQHSLLITTTLESICAPIVLYLTLYHSMQMKRYRYLIMNHVVWNLLMNWALCFYKPTLLFPAPCVTFAPAIHNTWFTGISSMFLVFLIVNVEMAVVWSVFYRFFMSYPGRVSDFVEHRRGSIIVFVVGQLLICFFALSPFIIFQRPSEARETAEFLKRLPHLQQYERSTGYLCTMDIEITGIVVLCGVMMLLFFLIVGMTILFILGHRVTSVNKGVFFAGNKHRMHKMLFKAVLVQVIVGFIFQLVPTALILLTFYAQWEEGTTIAAVCATMIQVHGCVDFITMMYFIVPYRRQLLRLVGRQPGKTMIYVNSLAPLTDYVVPFATAIETFCAPFIIYLALYHSRQMHRYRYLIVNNVVWSCLFNWVVSVMDPVFMYPSTCVLSYRKWLHEPYRSRKAMMFYLTFLVNVMFAMIWSLLYRYCMAFPGRLSQIAENGKTAIVIMMTVEVLCCFYALNPASLMNMPTPEDDRGWFMEQLPQFREIEPEVGYLCSPMSRHTKSRGVIGFFIVMFLIVGGLIMLGIMFYRVMFFLSKANNITAIRLHKMLLKALTAQLIVGDLFLLLPIGFSFLAFGSNWEEGRTISAFCQMLIQVHGCVDFITTIYFITPYRRKFIGMFKKTPLDVTRISTVSAKY
ncbi:unnamed protein product [Bursaphelenchus xylophilus]|uniref:(pine wood nematode) hypothetical protein n=1 Tax=Bursaphelenchus xylophilus TaxID=6326 RepID=A0A1I7RUP6_BURXY|nr:unnamed protein product [Bursaphelenchus xylophilus]CAG9114296.1 unnamed protein product [Bursaphelenchus xylophilus]